MASDETRGAQDPSRRFLRRVLGNSAWQLSADVATTALRAVEGFVVAAALGPTAFGVFAISVAFVSTGFQLLDFRVWEVITKHVIAYRSEGDTARARAIVRVCFGLNAATAVATFALIWILGPLAVGLFTADPEAASHVRLLAIGTLFAGPIITSSALLRVSNDFRVLAIKQVVVQVARFAAVVASLAIDATIQAVIVPIVLVSIADGVISGLLAWRALGRLGLTGWSRQPLATLASAKRQLVRLFVASNVSATLKLLQGQADVLLLGWLLPDAAVGQYRLARAVSEAARILVGGVYFACFPEFARMWAERDHAGLRRLAVSLLGIMTGLGAIAGAAMVLLAPVVPDMLGDAYAGSVPILRWLALATVLEVGSAVFHPLLFATDRARASMVALALGVAAELVVLAVIATGSGVAATGLAHVAFFVAWLAVMVPAARGADREAAGWARPTPGDDGPS